MAAYNEVIPTAKPGDPITAAMWNELVAHINRQRLLLGQGCGLAAQTLPSGTMLRVTGAPGGPDLIIAKTSAGVAARVGTAPGSGTATPQVFDGVNLAADSVDDVAVYNYATTSIASGKYCAICDCGDGFYFIVSVEC